MGDLKALSRLSPDAAKYFAVGLSVHCQMRLSAGGTAWLTFLI